MLSKLAASNEIFDAPLGVAIDTKRRSPLYGEEIVDLALADGAEVMATEEIETVIEQIADAQAACEYC